MRGFEELLAQERAREHLSSMISRGKIPHALLFSGVDGAGQREAAMLLAQIVLCLDRKPNDPHACDRCSSCLKVRERSHGDLHLLGLTDGRWIKTDALREEIRLLHLRPQEGVAKVLIVDPADLLWANAQEAFLKTLEEPPGAAYIILIASREWLLKPTILSRSQRVFFAPVPKDRLAKILIEEKSLPADQAMLLAGVAQGSITRAKEIDPAETIALRDRAAGLDVRLFPGKKAAVYEALAASTDLAEDRDDLAAVLDALLTWLHDQAVLASGAGGLGVTNVDRLKDLEGLVEERGLRTVLERANAVLYAKRRLDLPYNLNPQMIAEQVCLALAGQVVAPKDAEARAAHDA